MPILFGIYILLITAAIGLSLYATLLLIKALKIYISKNSQ